MRLATMLDNEGMDKGRAPLVRQRGTYEELPPCSHESLRCRDYAGLSFVARLEKA
jgi:hypothetical protein